MFTFTFVFICLYTSLRLYLCLNTYVLAAFVLFISNVHMIVHIKISVTFRSRLQRLEPRMLLLQDLLPEALLPGASSGTNQPAFARPFSSQSNL